MSNVALVVGLSLFAPFILFGLVRGIIRAYFREKRDHLRELMRPDEKE